MKPLNMPSSAIGPAGQPLETPGAASAQGSRADAVEVPNRVAGVVGKLRRLQSLLERHRVGVVGDVLDLSDLDTADRGAVADMLGEGEVTIDYEGACRARVQQTGLPGVWRVVMCGENGGLGRDTLEVADLPACVRRRAFEGRPDAEPADAADPGSATSRTLLDLLRQRSADWRPGDEPFVLDLSAPAISATEVDWLVGGLGTGSLSITVGSGAAASFHATGQPNIWAVRRPVTEGEERHHALVVTDVPNEALVAQHDISASARRLAGILDAFEPQSSPSP
jgi:hydrogenase-1 operon protein HyaF